MTAAGFQLRYKWAIQPMANPTTDRTPAITAAPFLLGFQTPFAGPFQIARKDAVLASGAAAGGCVARCQLWLQRYLKPPGRNPRVRLRATTWIDIPIHPSLQSYFIKGPLYFSFTFVAGATGPSPNDRAIIQEVVHTEPRGLTAVRTVRQLSNIANSIQALQTAGFPNYIIPTVIKFTTGKLSMVSWCGIL